MDADALTQMKTDFRQKASERLNAEGGRKPLQPVQERVADDDGPDEDVVDDQENNAESNLLDDESDLENDEAADDEEADDDYDDESVEARYERVERERAELEKKLSQVTANRRQMEEDFAQSQQQFVSARHEIDDALQQVRTGAEFYAGLAQQNLQQLQQVNPASLPAEQQQQYYQQLNQATLYAQQMGAAYENAVAQEREQRNKVKMREAEVAKAVLRTRIPEWSGEHYAKLGEVAQEYGFSPQEFGEITDPRIIQMLHNDWKSRRAAEVVTETVKQRKAKPPRSRGAKQQPRNAKGQYEKSRREFENNPGDRGAARNFFLQKLQTERKGRN